MVEDDNMWDRKVFDRMLKSVDVETVRSIESAQRALEILEGDAYDWVLSDIRMPGMPGFKCPELVHSSGQITKISMVVGLAAHTPTSADLRERCAACGTTDGQQKLMTLLASKDYLDKVVDSIITPTVE